MEPTDTDVAAAVLWHQGHWPRTISSGVIYHNGYKISILDFARVAQLIKPVLS